MLYKLGLVQCLSGREVEAEGLLRHALAIHSSLDVNNVPCAGKRVPSYYIYIYIYPLNGFIIISHPHPFVTIVLTTSTTTTTAASDMVALAKVLIIQGQKLGFGKGDRGRPLVDEAYSLLKGAFESHKNVFGSKSKQCTALR